MGKIIKSANVLSSARSRLTLMFSLNPERGANPRRVDALTHRLIADLLDIAATHPERREVIYPETGNLGPILVIECMNQDGMAFWSGQVPEVLENNGIPVEA